MMKKALSLLLAAALMLLAACGSAAPSAPDNALLVYRIVKPQFRLAGELLRGEEAALEPGADPVSSAAKAFTAPEGEQTLSSLPDNIQIVSAEKVGSLAKITVSPTYENLSGYKKILLDSCLTLTMCSLPDIEYVSFFVGSHVVSSCLSPDGLMLDNTTISADEVGVRLYFPFAAIDGLGYEYRGITISEDSSAERLVIEGLLGGPTGARLVPCFDSSCVLLAVYTTGRVCSVSFASGFLESESLSDRARVLCIYSIVNSLTSLSNVDSVQLLIEGKSVSTIGGIDVSGPLTENKNI